MKKLLTPLAIILFITLPALTYGAQVQIRPQASIQGEYTDNLFLTEDDEESDFITEVSAGIILDVLGRTSGLSLSFLPGYAFYRDNTQYDSWRLPADLNAWKEFSKRTRLDFFNYFIYTEDPQADRGLTDDDGQEIVAGDTSARRGRDEYWRNTARLRLTHQFGRENSVYGEFYNSLLRNDSEFEEDDPDFDEDKEEYSPRIGVTYWLNPKWGIDFAGTYTRGEFDVSQNFHDLTGNLTLTHRLDKTALEVFLNYRQQFRDFDNATIEDRVRGDADNDYVVFAPSAGVNYRQRNWDASVAVGYGLQQIDGEGDEEGLFLESNINRTWEQRRWNVRLNVSSGLDNNDFGAERLGFEYYAQGGVSGLYEFTNKFNGTGGLTYRYADQINRDSDTDRVRFNLGLAYQPLKWMTVDLGYEFNYYDTKGRDLTDSDYDENRFSLRLTFSPALPWKL